MKLSTIILASLAAFASMQNKGVEASRNLLALGANQKLSLANRYRALLEAQTDAEEAAAADAEMDSELEDSESASVGFDSEDAELALMYEQTQLRHVCEPESLVMRGVKGAGRGAFTGTRMLLSPAIGLGTGVAVGGAAGGMIGGMMGGLLGGGFHREDRSLLRELVGTPVGAAVGAGVVGGTFATLGLSGVATGPYAAYLKTKQNEYKRQCSQVSNCIGAIDPSHPNYANHIANLDKWLNQDLYSGCVDSLQLHPEVFVTKLVGKFNTNSDAHGLYQALSSMRRTCQAHLNTEELMTAVAVDPEVRLNHKPEKMNIGKNIDFSLKFDIKSFPKRPLGEKKWLYEKCVKDIDEAIPVAASK